MSLSENISVVSITPEAFVLCEVLSASRAELLFFFEAVVDSVFSLLSSVTADEEALLLFEVLLVLLSEQLVKALSTIVRTDRPAKVLFHVFFIIFTHPFVIVLSVVCFYGYNIHPFFVNCRNEK